MGEAVAASDTPQKNASCGVIEELWCTHRKGAGAGKQATNDNVPPDSETTSEYAEESCTT